ncbi:MAG: hypothetical protein KC421_09050 [Anaerolineales bacterium]|nr:hypothetical protein [Anaerolineales bacterium]
MFLSSHNPTVKVGSILLVTILLTVWFSVKLISAATLTHTNNKPTQFAQTTTSPAADIVTSTVYLPFIGNCINYSPRQPLTASTSFGGTITLTNPIECNYQVAPAEPLTVSGRISNQTGGQIWVLVYPHKTTNYYPQADIGCPPTTIVPDPQGNWSVIAYLGKKGNPSEWFDIVVVITDNVGHQRFIDYFDVGCTSDQWPGIPASEMQSLNITEKYVVTLKTTP